MDTASQWAAQCTLCTECQCKEARHIKQVLGNASGGAISHIKVTTAAGLIKVDSQADMEHHTMDMCLARFRLMESTPLMIEPLCSELAFLGITDATHKILTGTYQPPLGVADITHEFITTLAAPAPLSPTNLISCQITCHDFQQHWRSICECTSSSLSGLHYGHYKAAAWDDFLSEIHAIMTELAITGEAPLQHWQSGLSVMLEKKLGKYQVNKLWAILLMEADFNFFNGLMFSKRLMHWAEHNDWIPHEI